MHEVMCLTLFFHLSFQMIPEDPGVFTSYETVRAAVEENSPSYEDLISTLATIQESHKNPPSSHSAEERGRTTGGGGGGGGQSDGDGESHPISAILVDLLQTLIEAIFF